MNTPNFLWPSLSHPPALDSDQIHVCAWNIDRAPTTADWKILDEEETVRARRFVFPRDRDRYVRSHATVRRLLGSYAEISPAKISFETSEYGKPSLRETANGSTLEFNLTHSGGVAVLAVARRYPLGVDIELIRAIDLEIAEHHFSTRELETLRSLPEASWLAGFFRCWTSKEALLKGEGMGLNLALDSFDVEADPLRPPDLLASRSVSRLSLDWKLFGLQPTPEIAGALAVRNAGRLEESTVQCAVQCFVLTE